MTPEPVLVIAGVVNPGGCGDGLTLNGVIALIPVAG
jgi:hypothetical protein